MTRVFSGMQPSGVLHLGNYLGALVNWVAMQETADVTYCIVDLHAITAGHDPASLSQRTLDVAMQYVAAGVDPDRSTLFVQSHVGDVHTELTWLLNAVTGVGELMKMPQYKDKSRHAQGRNEQVPAGLLTYPVLQTSDILLHDADEVPVGEDQRHHIELARDIGGRFNHRYGDTFVLPKGVYPQAGARVMDLQDPTAKMSKSATSEKGLVGVLDNPARIIRTFKAAQTDSDRHVAFDRQGKAGISNLLEIMAAASGRSIDDLVDEYHDAGYGHFKVAVAEAVVELLAPVRERYEELAADPGEMQRILRDGAAKAREVASVRLETAKQAMGFLPA